MKRILLIITTLLFTVFVSSQNADDILKKVESNISSDNRIFESTMIINGARSSRTITSKSYVVGDKQSFTEYLSPAREKGTKMLKLENQLWIYSPSTDRIIQIAGHMLRQSVMGSDLSYEDMMDDRKLTDIYSSKVTGNDNIEGRETWILELTAKVTDVAYQTRKMWIDTERYVPLREELFAKSGQMLKRTTMSEVENINGRWFPTKIVYKDLMKQGGGTEFKITQVQFNQKIPDHIFTKASLKQ
ncbi:MAG TPA: outer membrane lipoprotein-sorting protein [Bacteroidales bacterium]|nr:outer membrane lipoprotein-sorting protein [Bacteroidales bacterium]